MINQSLRMMEIDQIILMGSFVRDLNNNIAEIHAQQLTENSCRKPLIAYRAIHCKINQQILSPTRVNLAASYNNIGLVYGKIGDYLNALLSYQRALEIYLKTLPSKHSDLATFYNNIGSVYDKIGDDSNSLSSHNKALEIRQKTLPLSHPHLATSYNNIAVVYAKMNDYSNALLYYQEALAIDENNLSSNSSDSYLNIGMFFSKTGEHSEAVRYCEKVLEIAEYSLQGNHRRIQVFRNALKYEKKKWKILSNENLEAIYNRFDPLREDMSKDPAFLDELATVKNPLQNIVQLKDNDIRFSNRVMKAKSRQERYKKGYILLEGKRLIGDAIQAGADLLTIFVTDRKILDTIDFSTTDLNFTAYQISSSAFRIWSDVQTNQGVMAIFAMPRADSCSFPQRITLPITVVCDNVRDPGNMGTIIRTCAAVGCDRLIALKGCVDIWDPKVIRSGMGAHFRLPMIYDVGWETIANHVPENSKVYLADHKYSDEEKPTNHDIDDPSKKMFEEMLEKRKEMKRTNTAEDRSYSSSNNRFLPLYKNIPIDYLSMWKAFSNVKSTDHTTIIIGGETEGISLQARKLTVELNGKRVYIPLLNDVESLNVSIALSVILMELRKSYEDIVQKSFSIKE
ncbi:unnamed protein product [Rotaria socialis]